MDTNKDGLIGQMEFVHYFNESLPREKEAFDEDIEQFMIVAEQVRHNNQNDQAAAVSRAEQLRRDEEDEAAAAGHLRRQLEEDAAEAFRAEQLRRQKEEAEAAAVDSRKAYRQQRLSEVFVQFDYDESGSIETHELLLLGQARRSTGQKSGEWSPDRNRRLVDQMDTNKDGLIGQMEFVHYFNESLPREKEAFDEVIEQFMIVAEQVRHNNQNDQFHRQSEEDAAEAFRAEQ